MTGLLDDAWGGFNEWVAPTRVPEGASYDPQTLGMARMSMLGHLGANLLAGAQRGLTPAQRSFFIGQAAQAPSVMGEALQRGGEMRLQAMRGRQLEQELRSAEASDRMIDAEIARRSEGGGVTPVNLPAAQRTGSSGDVMPAIGIALDTLEPRESGGNPGARNSLGYSGLYQMGTGLAHAAGLYQPAQGEAVADERGRAVNAWRGTWNVPGFDPMTHEQFLQNAAAQRAAAERAMQHNWGQIQARGLDRYVGQTVGGVQITPQGMLQGAWLGGVGGLEQFLTGQGDAADSNRTRVSSYVAMQPREGGRSVGRAASMDVVPASGGAPAGAAPGQPVAGAPRPTSDIGGLTVDQLRLLRAMPPQQRNQWLLQRSTEQRPRILTQDEAQAVGLSPGTVATIGPNGLTVVQAGQQDQQRQQALSATSSLRGELANTQAYKDWQNVSPRVQAMRQAVDIDNQAADMDMIFAWANIIDPGSVVRSEEGRLIARTGGPVEGLRGYINSLNGGARLTPEVRQQLMRQAESRLATYEDPFRQQVNRYRRLAERAGFDPDLIHDAIPEQRQSRYQRPQDAQPEPPRPEQGQTLPVPGGNPVAFVQGLREAVRNRQATAQQAQEIMRRHGLDPSLFNVGG